MKPIRLVAALLALVLAAAPEAPLAETGAPPAACRPFVLEPGSAYGLVRLCARLVEAQGRGRLSEDETEAAQRLADYLVVLARLELRVAPAPDGHRLRVARRTSVTARYLIADHLGLIAIADRLAPAA